MTACRGLKLGAVVRSAESPYALGFRGEGGAGGLEEEGGEGAVSPVGSARRCLPGWLTDGGLSTPAAHAWERNDLRAYDSKGAIGYGVGMAPGEEGSLTCARPSSLSSGASFFSSR